MPQLNAVSNGQLSDASMWNQFRDLYRGNALYDVVAGYGADPTGVGDSTTAVQAALTAASVAGGLVYFPAGKYKISATLNVTGDGVHLMGAARGDEETNSGSCLTSAASFTGSIFLQIKQSGTPSRPCQGITISDLLLEGSANTATTVDGIYFSAFNSLICNCMVAEFSGIGIHCQGLTSPAWNLYNSIIENCWVAYNLSHGIYLDTFCSDMHIRGCHIYWNGNSAGGGDGIRTNGQSDTQISNCHLYGGYRNGIYFLGGVAFSTVDSCVIEGHNRTGIMFDDTGSGAYRCAVRNCSFFGNGEETNNTYDHITVAPNAAFGTHVVIVGCVFNAPGSSPNLRYGISLSSTAQYCLVADCSFTGGAYGTAQILANGSNSLPCAVRGNAGHNPKGSLTPPSIPSSGGAAVTNPFNYDCTVYVAKAATTGPGPVTISGTSTGITLGSTIPVACFRVPAGATIGLGTYTGAAPTWTWFGD